jgi:hypothetical protein
MRRGLSARSDGNVLITSSSLSSTIFATFSHRTKNITTRSERTYRCRRTRRFGAMCAEQGACVRPRSWAGYTINMFEFEFPTGTGANVPHVSDIRPARAASGSRPAIPRASPCSGTERDLEQVISQQSLAGLTRLIVSSYVWLGGSVRPRQSALRTNPRSRREGG